MNEPKTKQALSDLRKAIGGEWLTVRFMQNAAGEVPASQELFIKSLSVKNSDLVIKCIDDEMALAAIFTDKEPDWLDTLEPDSFNQMVEKGREINGSFFDYCSKKMVRKKELQAKFMPEIKAREDEMMREAVAAMHRKMDQMKLSELKTSQLSVLASAP